MTIYRRWRRIISLTLSFTILTTSTAPAFADTQKLTPQQVTQEQIYHMYEQIIPDNAEWREFVRSPWQQPKWDIVPPNDPSRDIDPYFMRAQHWIPAGNDTEQDGKIVLQLDDANQALEIDQNLELVLETEDYAFMKAKSPAMFTQKSPKGELPMEGLFFVDKRDMQVEALRKSGARHPVPVFFYPFETQNWTTDKVEGLQIGEDFPVMIFTNGNKEDKQVTTAAMMDQFSKALHEQLRVLVLNELRRNPLAVKAAVEAFKAGVTKDIEIPNILPPRFSTAFFGTYLTGDDPDHPENSIIKTASNEKSSIMDLILPTAHADILEPWISDPTMRDVTWRLIQTSLVMSGIGVVALVGRAGYLNQKLNDRMAEVRDWRQARGRSRPTERGEYRWQYWNLVSYLIPATLSFPAAAFVYGAGYANDRIFTPNKAFHRFGRKIIEGGLERARKRFEGLNLGPKALGNGGVLGSSDMAQMMVQLLIFTPWLFPSMADTSWVALIGELFRGAAMYFIMGAYMLATNAVQGIQSEVEPEIDRQMQARGEDIYSREGRAKRQAIVDKRVDQELIARGYSPKEERIFSGPSAYRAMIGKLFNYGVDYKDFLGTSATEPAGDAAEEDKKVEMPLLHPGREGMMPYVYKVAMEKASRMATLTGDSIYQEVAANLAERARNFEMIKRSASKLLQPKEERAEAIQKGLDERARLGAMKHRDSGSQAALQLNPGSNSDREAAVSDLEDYFFRQAYDASFERKEDLLVPTREELASVYEESMAEAKHQLEQKNPMFGYTPGDARFLAIEIAREKIAAKHEQEDFKKVADNKVQRAPGDWGPTKVGWWERWQRAKSSRKAKIETAKIMRDRLDNVPAEMLLDDQIFRNPEAAEIYKTQYRKQLEQRVALVTPPEDHPVMQASLTRAEVAVEELLKNSKIQAHMQSLSAEEQILYVSQAYGEEFLNAYSDNTVSNQSFDALDGPAQPGLMQGVRQNLAQSGLHQYGQVVDDTQNWVNRLKRKVARGLEATVRKTIRVIESPFDNKAHRLGFKNALSRKIPLMGDFFRAVQAKKGIAITEMTVQYLTLYVGFGVHIPWVLSAFFVLGISPMIMMIMGWLERMFLNCNIPPQEDWKVQFAFSIPYSWASYWPYIPYILGAPYVKAGWDTTIQAVTSFCQRILGM